MTNKTTYNPEEVAHFSQLAAQWWDSEGPLKTLHDINPVRMAFMQEYVSFAKMRVLDVGCGAGILSEAIAQAGAQVCGLDASEELIACANSHAKGKGLTLEYLCTLIEDYEAPLFDSLCCMELLEHVDDPALVIHHCARLLKPGGWLFLSTINRTPTAYASVILAAEYVLGLLPRQTHDYQKFIKPAELAAMLRAEKLELHALTGLQYNPFTRKASLKSSVAANYLVACFKP